MTPRVFLVAVVAIALTLLASVISITVLALQEVGIPDVLQNVAVGSLTGLVGLLVQSREPTEGE
jgi:hypothetical protein